MILTGSAIASAVATKAITIDPFEPSRLNPNSYNYRVGPVLYEVCTISSSGQYRYESREVAQIGGRWRLDRGRLYLGTTLERIGSDSLVVSLIGRSSIGRLGLFVQVSANIGHQGACHCWTLEFRPSLPIYIYPGQIIGQVSFWQVQGPTLAYSGRYGFSDFPLQSNLGNP